MDGTEALHGCSPAEALLKLQREIRDDIGITVSIGLSGTKSLAKMASDRDKPDGFFAIGMTDAAAGWRHNQFQSFSVLAGLPSPGLRRQASTLVVI